MGNLEGRIKKVEIFFKERDLVIYKDSYINARKKVNLIDGIGYKYFCTANSLQHSKNKPDKVSKRNPYTIENIKLWLKLNKPQDTLLSTTYVDSSDLLKFKCQEHGEFNMCWGNINQGQNCPECSKIIGINKQKLDLNDVKIDVHNKIPTITVISNEWINTTHKIKCHCSVCNNEWDAWHGNLMKGEGCPVCGLRKGENNGGWKGGITPLQNNLRSHTITPWKLDSLNYYNNTCCITGKKDAKELLIHHKYGFNLIVRETMEIVGLPIYDSVMKYTKEQLLLIKKTCLELHYKYGLGVCICKEVHIKFHNIYGSGNNTPEQWYEFVRNFYTN